MLIRRVRQWAPQAILSALIVSLASTVTAAPPETQLSTAGKPAIAIIIDDIGNHYRLGRKAIHLPGKLTYSVLPFTQHAQSLANRAHNLGKEVMIHLPMQNLSGQPLGPGGLHAELGLEDFRIGVSRAIREVPHAIGLNNHMGSALTRDPIYMSVLMDEIKRHQLYFVDSRTTAETVALQVAREKALVATRRDVFLDNTRTESAIHTQFQQLLRKARRKGSAVAIGHPYPETIAYLARVLPSVTRRTAELIPVSELIARDSSDWVLAQRTDPAH